MFVACQQHQPAVQERVQLLQHSEILATLESGNGRNDHHMHTIHCPHKLHTQYFQTWTYCDYKNEVKSTDKGQNNYYNAQMPDIHLGPSL